MDKLIMSAPALDPAAQGQRITELGNEVLSLWKERVQREKPSVTLSGEPLLADYIGVLFDNIAEHLVPGMLRPFGTAPGQHLSNFLVAAEPTAFVCTDDAVKELQIFRSVIFSVTKRRGFLFTSEQCEVAGDLIDAAIRDAITACSVAEREIREAFIAELSHDLRNPLNIASALAQLIQRRPDNEKVAVMATRIYEKIAETDAMLQSTVATMYKK